MRSKEPRPPFGSNSSPSVQPSFYSHDQREGLEVQGVESVQGMNPHMQCPHCAH
ncbi:hypothetical protein BAE44_0017008 [Dichanthelium oligosanthes]|uniref:Uncharacterized protein n=1 Tax=Dichanthelium oligosanthes TaxID=888268 RepID=A0A1E5V9Y4_9POAL|nr:hypothetical protein BAE44_0017008 [Dichanthelium oligosanthes]